MHGTPLLSPKADHDIESGGYDEPQPPTNGGAAQNSDTLKKDALNRDKGSYSKGGPSREKSKYQYHTHRRSYDSGRTTDSEDNKMPSNPRDSKSLGEMACDEGPGLCAHLITFISILLVLVTIPFSLCFAVKVVQEYERVVIFRLGRLLSGGARGPGIFFIVPCVDSYQKVDMRTLTFDVPPQEILTKDSVTVHVDAIMYYKVSNATCAISNVDDYGQSTRLLAATTLRNVLGTKNLGDILSERESIANMMQSTLDEATDPWGVKVERVEVKDVRLPQQLQRAMAAEAEAAREARAKVIAAEGEHQASRSLANAAEVIAQSPAALQLRYLQTLNNISAEKNSTIVFPVPVDIISHLMGMKGSDERSRTQTPMETLVH
ncbi:hypothetical protein TCAL_11835 [Tigriopus californicus]|uniref:Band 7 domain-containing protein n=1 Tax=Tigriopus californicus TaxID=6832 RepID=A0A553NBY4_TIGCA|nr:band 7 protein AGAP004871-like [Tigriopus californicus]TRY62953.1 hypothetical protein TCAL_11835 [Tigriopus californicus]|eukprot:TCALIF_11835-PA protein Name:"Similar to mec-2 Mechanosensory protein 2 (Caenorhabditis elegans)" AED:0.29 eAED:0.29 QI:1/0.71/0.37/0.75/0.85/0.87/8/0/376